MHYLILAIIISVSLFDQFTTRHVLPRFLVFAPEALSALVVLYVIVFGTGQRFRYVRAQYWLIFGGIAVVMLCGAFANAVAPGPIVAGLRYYARAIPLFFLPAVYDFKDWQIRQQLRLLLVAGLWQLPFAIHQRMIVMGADRFSGDSVVGTLLDSSVLSIYLICAVCVLTGFFLRQRVSKLTYFFLFFYLLAATTINETKGTLILLPVSLLTVVIVGAPAGKRLRNFLLTIVLFVAFLAAFAPIYDYMERNNPYYTSIEDFFTNQKKVGQYLDTHSGVGTKHPAGRVDAIVVPLKKLSADPVQLVLGLGVGNASHSSLGPQFIGAYYILYEGFLISSMSVFLLEIGILGTALVFVLYWMIFRDSLIVARTDDSFTGWIAIGWSGVALLVVVATAYKTMHAYASLSYLFWYFSGLISARRMRLSLGAESSQSVVALREVAPAS